MLPKKNSVFTREQFYLLQKLFRQPKSTQKSPNANVASVAQLGNTLCALNATTNFSTWTVDFRASDHMTGDVSLLINFFYCGDQPQVRIASGTYYKIVGSGNVFIYENLILESVFHAPNFKCDLLSIKKLTWMFFNSHGCLQIFLMNVLIFFNVSRVNLQSELNLHI